MGRILVYPNPNPFRKLQHILRTESVECMRSQHFTFYILQLLNVKCKIYTVYAQIVTKLFL